MTDMGTTLIEAQQYARRHAAKVLRNYPDDVEDVLQTAAMKAFRAVDSFRGAAQFKVWFTRIAINEALMFLRNHKKNARTMSLEQEEGERVFELPSKAPSPEAAAYASEIRAVIRSEMRSMSPTIRQGLLAIIGNIGQDGRGCKGQGQVSNAEKARCFRARQALRGRFLAEGMVPKEAYGS